MARQYGRMISVGRFRFRALSLLEKFRNRLATDPKDKVYALLGICDLDTSGPELEFQSHVPIDYTRSVLQVFRDTARAIIEYSTDLQRLASLDILSRQRHVQRKTGLADHGYRGRRRKTSSYQTGGDQPFPSAQVT
jgi:hypothetical protein